MTITATTGKELALESVEESIPYDTWLSWLKNLAIECIQNLHLSQFEGDKYSAVDFWKIMILSALLALSFDEAANQLNDVLWKEAHRHQRKKVKPKRLGGRVYGMRDYVPMGIKQENIEIRFPIMLYDL